MCYLFRSVLQNLLIVTFTSNTFSYMERRCRFLDNMPAYNYNTGVGEYMKTGETRIRTNTRQLGSTLMATMLREVTNFCDPGIKESWTEKGHQQVWYDKIHIYLLILLFFAYNFEFKISVLTTYFFDQMPQLFIYFFDAHFPAVTIWGLHLFL